MSKPTPPAKAQTLLTDFAAIQGALMILSNVLAAKIWGFSLGPLLVTFDAGLIIYPLTYVVGDLMIEIYGPRPANRLAWRCGALNLVAFVALWLADLLPAAPGMELYICPTCGRGELYLPQKALERRKEEEDRAWLRDFQEKVKAGEIAPQLFLCPTCGNPRRDRTCPFCGSVVDLKTMEEICPGKPS